MKAVGLTHDLPITDERSLIDLELPDPTPGPQDLLVAVRAVSVQPGVAESGMVDFILCLNSKQHHWDAMVRAIAPQGTIASIVAVSEPVNIAPLTRKSARFAWELMFTRAMCKTKDMAAHGKHLANLAQLIDEGTIKATGNTGESSLQLTRLVRRTARIRWTLDRASAGPTAT